MDLRHKFTSSLKNWQMVNSRMPSAIMLNLRELSGLFLLWKGLLSLLEERIARGIDNIALVRIEQLYPFPDDELRDILGAYTNMESVVWCQEEPINQGAWYSSQHHMTIIHSSQRLYSAMWDERV